MKTSIFAFALASALAGCAIGARSTSLEPSAYWFDYSATYRGALMIPKPGGEGYFICAEPSPDVAMDKANKLLVEASGSYAGIGGALKADSETLAEVVRLAGRTETVMFLREALYRLCEASLNGMMTPTQVANAYSEVVEVAADIMRADRANAERRRFEALKKLTEKDDDFASKYLGIEKRTAP